MPRDVTRDMVRVGVHRDAAEDDMREALFECDLRHEQTRRSLPVARRVREAEIAAVAPRLTERHRQLPPGALAYPIRHLIGMESPRVIDVIGEEHERVVADKRRHGLTGRLAHRSGCTVLGQWIAAAADDERDVRT